MPLRSELSELLSGFEKRMKFINIVRCLLEYPYPEKFKAMIPDKRILDNIIVSVLVFIKDKTLAGDQNCVLSDIEHFLDDFSVVFPEDYNIDSKALAKYIVVDILQNGGKLTEFLTYNSKTEEFENTPVRLINEERGSYHLTDDAFDFLFRAKEIESELDYSVTRFRMREYMKRNNYEKALEQSRELVSRIRSMKISMNDFLLSCRENITRISVDEYDSIILRIRNLLEDEYKELTEIQGEAKARCHELEKAQKTGIKDEEIHKHRMALREIIQNISMTIEEQRSLINKKATLSESYRLLLQDNFLADRYERLNFEKDIMSKLRKMNTSLGDAAVRLLFPLTTPEFEKVFSVENFYAIQKNLSEAADDDGIDISETDDDSRNETEERSNRFKNICYALFDYMNKKTSFAISEFIFSLKICDLTEYCRENSLPVVLLTLFSMQTIDIGEWKKSERFTVVPNGEFELSWCLEEMPEHLLRMKRIEFKKLDKSFAFPDGTDKYIDMTDFIAEVIR